MLTKILGGLARLAIGLAATVFLIAALLFVLGLHLSLKVARNRGQATVELAFDTLTRAGVLVAMMKEARAGTDDEPEAAVSTLDDSQTG